MEKPIFKKGDNVICLADYHSNEEIRLRAKDNGVYLPKKNQPLTINNIVLCAVDNCCYLQFEEIDNPLVNGEIVCFYQLNFVLSESIKKSLSFSEEAMSDMKNAVNKGIYALMKTQNNIGSLKMSEAIPFLGMIAIDYKLDLRRKGFKIAQTIFKRSVQLN